MSIVPDYIPPADLTARRLNAETAYYLVCASKCVYAGNDKWAELLGLQDRVTFFSCGPFRGMLARLDDAAILAFRGTQNVCNCLTDADTRLLSQPFYPGRVHHGFAAAVEIVWPEVRELLRPLGRNVPLWLTGHSLGGAMATLASVRLARDGYPIQGICTYGSPRVGDRVFRDAYLLPNYRFVNDNDFVPHLPLQWCYKHVGSLRLVDSENNKPDIVEDKKAWKHKKRKLSGKAKRIQRSYRRETDVIQAFTEFDWLADHRLDEYITAIRKFLPQSSDPPRCQSRPKRRIDPPQRDIARPALRKPAKFSLSEEAFAAAFAAQPQTRGGVLRKTA